MEGAVCALDSGGDIVYQQLYKVDRNQVYSRYQNTRWPAIWKNWKSEGIDKIATQNQ